MLRAFKRPLNWVLLVVSIASLCAILAARETLQKVVYDLGIGSAVSIIFYFLVVRLPDNEKRRRIRHSFERHWREFKEDCIATMLSVADGSYSPDVREELLDQKKFARYFQETVSPGQDRWDALHNNMDEGNLNDLLTYLEILRQEVQLVLLVVDVQDARVLEFLKRLSATIIRMRQTTLDYDSMKSFGSFLFEIFSGFDPVTGYRERDFFDEMIRAV